MDRLTDKQTSGKTGRQIDGKQRSRQMDGHTRRG